MFPLATWVATLAMIKHTDLPRGPKRLRDV